MSVQMNPASVSIKALSETGNSPKLGLIQTALGIIIDHLSGKEIKIIGGAACAILDHLYFNKPLFLRDLDLAVIMGQCITFEEARGIADVLKGRIPHIQKYTSLEERPRTPQDVPLTDGSHFSAGIGFFLESDCEELPMLDITLYHHEEDLHLNGLIEQDRVFIVLNQKRSFADFVLQTRAKSIDKLIDEGWIEQPLGAYQNWTLGVVKICNWEEIGQRPLPSTLRIVRSLGKKGLLEGVVTPNSKRSDLQEQFKDLHQAVSSSFSMELNFQSRLFQRCLKDKTAALELKALCMAGVFNKWLIYFNDAISGLTVQDIERLIPHEHQHSWENKLMALVAHLSLMQRLHTLFYAIGGPSNCLLAAKRVWDQLPDHFRRFGPMDLQVCHQLIDNKNSEYLSKSLSRILSSTSFGENEALDLLLRSLINDLKDLKALFPEALPADLEIFCQKALKPRYGFFTGVFDPFINVHLNIITHAIHEMALDQVIVAPVYLSQKRNRPSEPWKNRHIMIVKSLEGHLEAKAIDPDAGAKMEQGIEAAFSDLKAKIDAVWVHIAGADAFERFKHLDLLPLYQKESIRFFVVRRIGVRPTPIDPKYSGLVSYFDPVMPLGVSDIQSAQDVRKAIKGGQDISSSVSRKVKEYIDQHRLYAIANPAMQMPWVVLAPELFLNVIKQQLPYALNKPESSGAEVPKLTCEINDRKEDKQLVITYQQTPEHKRIVIKADCSPDRTEETARHLIETLIHDLIGH